MWIGVSYILLAIYQRWRVNPHFLNKILELRSYFCVSGPCSSGECVNDSKVSLLLVDHEGVSADHGLHYLHFHSTLRTGGRSTPRKLLRRNMGSNASEQSENT